MVTKQEGKTEECENGMTNATSGLTTEEGTLATEGQRKNSQETRGGIEALRRHYDYAEAYSTDSGEVRVAVIGNLENPRIRHLTFNELREELGEEDRDAVDEALGEIGQYPWTDADCGLPSEPNLTVEDHDLFSDVEKFIRDHVEFPETEYYAVCASWVIASYIPEEFKKAPRLIFHAPTRSGKTRAIDTLKLLSYRGVTLVDPSKAALFRIVEKHRPTILIDEGSRPYVIETLHDIFVSGFDAGRKIPRVNVDYEVEFFEPFCFTALATKRLPPEDWQNRGILINMQERVGDRVRHRFDFEEARRLRGRLLAFRLKVLAGDIELSQVKDQALSESQGTWKSKIGNELYLDDRAADVAYCLLVPGVLFSNYQSILKAVVESQAKAVFELRETLDAKVFFALQRLARKGRMIEPSDGACPDISSISTNDVKNQLNQDLMKQGDAGSREIPTRTVTSILITLGFDFRYGTNNKSFFEMGEKANRAWKAAVRKYGSTDVFSD